MIKKNNKRFIFYIALTVLLLIFFVQAIGKNSADEYKTLGELVADIKAGSVTEFSVNESGKATVKTNQGLTKVYTFTNLGYDFFIDHYGDMLQEQYDAGNITKLNFTPPSMATMSCPVCMPAERTTGALPRITPRSPWRISRWKAPIRPSA